MYVFKALVHRCDLACYGLRPIRIRPGSTTAKAPVSASPRASRLEYYFLPTTSSVSSCASVSAA